MVTPYRPVKQKSPLGSARAVPSGLPTRNRRPCKQLLLARPLVDQVGNKPLLQRGLSRHNCDYNPPRASVSRRRRLLQYIRRKSLYLPRSTAYCGAPCILWRSMCPNGVLFARTGNFLTNSSCPSPSAYSMAITSSIASSVPHSPFFLASHARITVPESWSRGRLSPPCLPVRPVLRPVPRKGTRRTSRPRASHQNPGGGDQVSVTKLPHCSMSSRRRSNRSERA